jgi:tryptophanyl-tRNA synthetase
MTIFAALTDRSLAEVVADYEGKGFADFKKALTDVAVARLGPMGEEMKRMVNDPSHVDQVLRDGGQRAAALAQPILDEVYDIVGFLRP